MVGLSFLSAFIAFGSEIDSLCNACTIAPTMAVAKAPFCSLVICHNGRKSKLKSLSGACPVTLM